eukprot:11217785-Alexandrium_andersonii.AAC.1
MAALKRWWKRVRRARWCTDEVEEFLRASGQTGPAPAAAATWAAGRGLQVPESKDDAGRMLA